MKLRALLIAAALCLLSGAAFASGCPSTSLTFKDAAGATQTLCFGGSAGQYVPQYEILDSAGVNALTVTAAGHILADAGSNLNTSLLALESGGNLATLVTDSGAPGATACATDTSSCNFNQLFQRIAQRLSTVNTTLGSPAQESGGNLATIAGSLGGCAGQTPANTNVTPINNAGASSNLKLISKVAAKNIYICAIDIGGATAVNVALVEGTQTTNQCDTNTAGMAGGATAATGWQLGATSGLTKGNGTGIIYKTATVNHDVCLLFSAGVQVSGALTWVQF